MALVLPYKPRNTHLERIMGYITMGGHYLAAMLLSAVRRESCSQDFLNFVS
jgi:hypothetical protein